MCSEGKVFFRLSAALVYPSPSWLCNGRMAPATNFCLLTTSETAGPKLKPVHWKKVQDVEKSVWGDIAAASPVCARPFAASFVALRNTVATHTDSGACVASHALI